MNTPSRFQLLAATCALTALVLPSCAKESSASSPQAPKTAAVAAVQDQPIATFRGDLLELAFDAASAFPLKPHIKSRSRAQEAVVRACLELDQTERAVRYANGIADWRRSSAYADIAYHLAKNGRMDRVQEYLDIALKGSSAATPAGPDSASDAVENSQEWRRDRVRASIARTYILLGKDELAAQIAAGVVDSEVGAIHREKARNSEPESFESQLKVLDTLVTTGSFDSLLAALNAYAELFNRYYDESARRQIVEEKIPLAWAKLPIDVRLQVQIQLAGYALAHQDSPKALAILDEAQKMLDGTAWESEYHVPMRAKLAAARFRAGDHERARRDADAVLAAYEKDHEKIVNMFRAGVLRPLAETYHVLGDSAKARAVYARVLEEGALNPNARPRAEDLAATATSMAVNDVEPDAALLARMKEIRSKLVDPW